MNRPATPPCPTPTLVHENPRLLVLDKPAGLLCVPGRGPEGVHNLATWVQARWPDALVVHRLDMSTSGLVLFGRGAAVQRALSIAFAERRVDKRYQAVVAGLIDGDSGEIDLPLAADWPNRPRQQVSLALGKPSRTHWTLLSRDAAAGTSRLALQPITGRTHQLRLHLAAIGHAILGDALYAPPAVAAAAPRLLLHARQLAWDDEAGHHDFSSAVPF